MLKISHFFFFFLGLKEQNFVKENNGILKIIFFNEIFQN